MLVYVVAMNDYAPNSSRTKRRTRMARSSHESTKGSPALMSESDAAGITRADVAHLANLARIDLSDDELDRVVPELSVILDSVAAVAEVAAEDIPPTSHAVPLTNVFRDDQVRPSLAPDEALAMAPEVDQQRFSVPRILGDEQ